MNVSRTALQSVLDNIVNSVGYKTTVGPVDKGKVNKAILGQLSPRPSARLAQAPFDLARLLNPIGPPPPPPPPVYKKVAPRAAYGVPSADARYCVENQPGVILQPNGRYRDDVAEYDSDGLCLGIERSPGPAVTAANDINGRPYCSLPLMGEATENTGSWAI